MKQAMHSRPADDIAFVLPGALVTTRRHSFIAEPTPTIEAPHPPALLHISAVRSLPPQLP